MIRLNDSIILNIFFVVLILLFSPVTRAQDCTSVISVRTSDPGAVILINGREAGRGNTELTVEKGTYIVIAKNNPESWNSLELTDSVVFSDCGERKEFSFRFGSSIYLNSSPQDAYVFHKDSLIGHTPLFVPVNMGRLELRKENYSSREFFTDKVSGSSTVSLEYRGPMQQKSFLKSNTFRILTGTALALGAAAAYYKIKADNSYDEYLLSRDPSLLDKTDRYDLISGVALGALQVNFGALIYFFLTD